MVSRQNGDGFVLDATKRDRFELLSAYLDGEVTPEEGRLVNHWLAHDADVQNLYRRLLLLRRAFRTPPIVPAASRPTPEQVLQSIKRHRLRTASLAVAFTVVALMASSLTNFLGIQPFPWRLTQLDGSELHPQEVPELALDEPAIELPAEQSPADFSADQVN